LTVVGNAPGVALALTSADLAWILPLLALPVAVGLGSWVSWQLHRKRTGRWFRELQDTIGQADLGPIESARDADRAWRTFLEYVEETRRLQLATSSRDVTSKLVSNENSRLRSVFQALPTGILVLRAARRILYANEVARNLLQVTDRDEPVLESAEGDAHMIGVVRSILSGDLARGIRSERVEVRQPDQEPQVYRVRLLTGTFSDDQLDDDNIQIVTFENITAEESTRRMKTEFVYGVSHELKTPLTSIQASLEMLAEDEDLEEGDRKRLVDLSYAETIRLGRMVRELLDLARVEAGVTEVKRERVLVPELMKELYNIHAPLAERKSIELDWEVSDFVPTLLGDRDLLLQSFVNLIGNAVKYTPDSGRVEVKVSVVGEELRFLIRDTGIGIPAEDLDRIFDRFYRASSAKKTSIPGTGLGLPMARFIIETHGGRVEVESEEGKGSTFCAYLPGEEAGSEDLDTTSLQSLEALTG
jgi:signal transduction histidine kinase